MRAFHVPNYYVAWCSSTVVRVSFTAPLYVVQQSKGPAMVCIVATPRAAVPVTVKVVAGEDTVPSAQGKGGSGNVYSH